MVESHLAKQIERMSALYHMYGREGLGGFSACEVRLLMSAKQLELGNVATRLQADPANSAQVLIKMQLELQIKELGMTIDGMGKDRGKQMER